MDNYHARHLGEKPNVNLPKDWEEREQQGEAFFSPLSKRSLSTAQIVISNQTNTP